MELNKGLCALVYRLCNYENDKWFIIYYFHFRPTCSPLSVWSEKWSEK